MGPDAEFLTPLLRRQTLRTPREQRPQEPGGAADDYSKPLECLEIQVLNSSWCALTRTYPLCHGRT